MPPSWFYAAVFACVCAICVFAPASSCAFVSACFCAALLACYCSLDRCLPKAGTVQDGGRWKFTEGRVLATHGGGGSGHALRTPREAALVRLALATGFFGSAGSDEPDGCERRSPVEWLDYHVLMRIIEDQIGSVIGEIMEKLEDVRSRMRTVLEVL